jgi:hypothetical protein
MRLFELVVYLPRILQCNKLLVSKTAEASFNQGLCVGIILGVEDNAHYDKKICVPKNMNIRDRLIVVKNYAVLKFQ